MTKIQLIEYGYHIFVDLLKNMMDNFTKSEAEKKIS